MLILVRHGERADNCDVERTLVKNKIDPHLTQKGIRQAERAAKYIKSLISHSNITVESSPFLRCLMTSKAICHELEINQIRMKTEICECLYPELFTEDPLSKLQVTKGPVISHEVIDEQTTSPYPENLCDVDSRITNYVQQLLEQLDEDECRILTTHQRPIKCVLEKYNQDSSDVGYCKVVALKKSKNSITVIQ